MSRNYLQSAVDACGAGLVDIVAAEREKIMRIADPMSLLGTSLDELRNFDRQVMELRASALTHAESSSLGIVNELDTGIFAARNAVESMTDPIHDALKSLTNGIVHARDLVATPSIYLEDVLRLSDVPSLAQNSIYAVTADQLNSVLAAADGREFLREQMERLVRPIDALIGDLSTTGFAETFWAQEILGFTLHARQLFDEEASDEDIDGRPSGAPRVESYFTKERFRDFVSALLFAVRELNRRKPNVRIDRKAIFELLTIVSTAFTVASYLQSSGQNAWERERAGDARASEEVLANAVGTNRQAIDDLVYRDAQRVAAESMLAKQQAEMKRLLEDLAEHILEPQLSEYVGGGRVVNVRSTRDGGYIVGKLHPNQPVSVVAEDGRKVKISFYDAIEGRNVEGWVLADKVIKVPSIERSMPFVQ